MYKKSKIFTKSVYKSTKCGYSNKCKDGLTREGYTIQQANLARLKDLRLENNTTQQAIAKLLGISNKAYSNKELGNRNFSIEEARILGKYFNVSIEELFFEK